MSRVHICDIVVRRNDCMQLAFAGTQRRTQDSARRGPIVPEALG